MSLLLFKNQIHVDNVIENCNFLVFSFLRFELINRKVIYFLSHVNYKVRKLELILKGGNTNWLSFNLKSFPHLHGSCSDIDVHGIREYK